MFIAIRRPEKVHGIDGSRPDHVEANKTSTALVLEVKCKEGFRIQRFRKIICTCVMVTFNIPLPGKRGIGPYTHNH